MYDMIYLCKKNKKASVHICMYTQKGVEDGTKLTLAASGDHEAANGHFLGCIDVAFFIATSMVWLYWIERKIRDK